MVRPASSTPTGTNDEAFLIGGAIVLGLTGWAVTYAALSWTGQDPPVNPANIAIGLASGDLAWTTATTIIAVGTGVAVLLVVALVALAVALVRGRPVPIDAAARHMATRREIDAYTHKSTTKKAAGLVVAPSQTGIGLPLGLHLPSKARFWSSWEDMIVLMAGPRTMKSSSYTIPLALAAPGACLITENKRGVLDHTRGARAQIGQVWVFDPQGVADEPVGCWWNPLTYVTDESRAERMARQIAESTRTPGHKTPYFDDAAVSLIANLLLAAACERRTLPTVYSWLVTPTDEHPVDTLRNHGYPTQADDLYAKAHLSDRQRDGVYGTAQQVMSFCTNRRMMAWVTPPADARAQRFDPHTYVRSTDTLYALSKDGNGSAGPLVGALTMAVFDAAEEYATEEGRMPVPLVGLLDEAANVCRLTELDSKYSHYGSRGIILMTVLQSPDQAEEIWGKHGWNKLWSTANVKIYGGGVYNTELLRQMSDLIGTYEHQTGSTSTGRGGRSRSRSVTDKPVLTVSELGALPRGRAVVIGSGIRPALVKVVPWFKQTKDLRARVEASLEQHDPVRARRRPAAVAAVVDPTAGPTPARSPWDVGPIER
ncbi:type IV secretory system conjugative DNA transfer family protein [Solicola sp. PLA-1-18]|uniref:type IV secretory system conjugative DNA transfer family protein n=1 Tax=Solicola sp. PLA-1-18 TaxID=3380532 RepID=UPI003B7C1ECF